MENGKMTPLENVCPSNTDVSIPMLGSTEFNMKET